MITHGLETPETCYSLRYLKVSNHWYFPMLQKMSARNGMVFYHLKKAYYEKHYC
jgi:hypothetical protein